MLDHATIAERVAYGSPLPGVPDDTIRVAPRPTTALIGRILIAAIFVVSGLAKLVNTDQTAEHMAGVGIPAPHFLAVVAGLVEILGALAIGLGFLTRVGALALIAFMIPATLLFHNFWVYDGAEQKTQMINFLKNLTTIGGLCMLFAYGAGRYSIDARLRRPMQP